MPDVLAAGGVVWREIDGLRHVGVVMRPRYGGDVTLPKGKLEPGETLKDCALREVAEELGVEAALGEYIGSCTYGVANGDKYVMFWEMRWVGDDGSEPDGREIIGREWLTIRQALDRLSYPADRHVLAAAVARHRRP